MVELILYFHKKSTQPYKLLFDCLSEPEVVERRAGYGCVGFSTLSSLVKESGRSDVGLERFCHQSNLPSQGHRTHELGGSVAGKYKEVSCEADNYTIDWPYQEMSSSRRYVIFRVFFVALEPDEVRGWAWLGDLVCDWRSDGLLLFQVKHDSHDVCK
jgi:hypothetical protein